MDRFTVAISTSLLLLLFFIPTHAAAKGEIWRLNIAANWAQNQKPGSLGEHFGYGLGLAWVPGIFEFGIHYKHLFPNNLTLTTGATMKAIDFYEGVFHFRIFPLIWFGAQGGYMTVSSVKTNADGTSDINIRGRASYGPSVGIEYKVSDSFSFGLDGHYRFSEDTDYRQWLLGGVSISAWSN